MPEKKVSLSVIIPVFNTEEFLQQCINSVLSSSLEDLEIIIINDCSPGNCIQIVQEYMLQTNKIKIINHPKNMGLLASRLTGIEAANGKYIVHLDSDDYIENDIYAKSYQKAMELDANIVLFNTIEEYKSSRYIYDFNTFKNFAHYSGKNIVEFIFESNSIEWQWHSLCNKLVKAIHYKKLLSYHIQAPHLIQCEDLYLSLSLYLNLFNHQKIYTTIELGLIYRRQENSITITHNYATLIKKSYDILYFIKNIKSLLIYYQQYTTNKDKINSLIYHLSTIHFLEKPTKLSFSFIKDYLFVKLRYIFMLNIRGLIKLTADRAAMILVKKVKSLKLRHVSIFGNGDLSDKIVKLLRKDNITVDYIIATNTVLKEGIKTITPNEISNTQIGHIVVASIGSYSIIKRMLIDKNANTYIITL